jgi:hypothetical protein
MQERPGAALSVGGPADLGPPPPVARRETIMSEAVVFLGQAALVLAAMLVVLMLVVCIPTLLVWAGRKIRQLYGLSWTVSR